MASRSAEYYKKNPEARKKKAEYDKKYHSTPERKKYRADLQRERRKRKRNGENLKGKDISHTKSGGYTTENRSKNRARQGANGKSTKK